jgi:hypothetical protein
MYSLEPLYEGPKAYSAGREGSGSECHMFLIEIAASLHLRLILLGPIVFNATVNISGTDIEVVTQVVRRLVHFLLIITVTTLASLRAWRASIIAGVSFIVALGTFVEIGSTTLMLRAFVVLMLASAIVARAMAVR